MDENNNMPTTEKSGSMGTLIAVIVILAIIIVGGLYFWSNRAGDPLSDEALESINAQSDSDDAASIEADLNATDLDSVDEGLDESEFNAS